jgi:phage-related protein
MAGERTYDDWVWVPGSAGGESPAEKEFLKLDPQARGALLDVIKHWLAGENTRSECEKIEDDLWELKTKLPPRNHYRILFCIRGRTCYGLTAFFKNQQRTPEADKRRARKRRKNVP